MTTSIKASIWLFVLIGIPVLGSILSPLATPAAGYYAGLAVALTLSLIWHDLTR